MRKFLVFLTSILFLFSATPAFAAIAFDATAQKVYTTGGTITQAMTIGSGSNRILFVMANDEDTNSDNITGVTYAGVSMARIQSRNGGTKNTFHTLYMLVNPTSGTNNIVVSNSNAGDGVTIIATSYTGASQTGQPDASTNNSGTAVSTITTSLITIADNSWMVSFVDDFIGCPAASTGVTARSTCPGSSLPGLGGDSNGPISPAASYSMTWTMTLEFPTVLQASFSPAAAATPANFGFFLLQWW